MSDNELTDRPQPYDWCYEWDGPHGTRTFSSSPRNGMKPTRSVPLFNETQMRAYAMQERVAERERCARLCEREAAMWRGQQDISDFKLCAAVIRKEV